MFGKNGKYCIYLFFVSIRKLVYEDFFLKEKSYITPRRWLSIQKQQLAMGIVNIITDGCRKLFRKLPILKKKHFVNFLVVLGTHIQKIF